MKYRALYSVTLLALVSACSSVPDRNVALESARSQFNVARNDPQVSSQAPAELKRAGEALRDADQARSSGESTVNVDHLAYLTSQRVVIARETAASRASQAITASAAAERDRLRLDARTNEVNAAQQQLAVSERNNAQKAADLALAEQSNAQKTADLAAAEANAARSNARIERRDQRVNDLEAQLRELNAVKTERGMVVTLGDVLFDTGKAELLPDGGKNVAKLAEFFRRYPDRTATIDGHTDSVGNANANFTLSERRASAVVSALISQGVAANRLTMRGHGAAMPAADNGTPAGRQMNRRVEVVFANSGM